MPEKTTITFLLLTLVLIACAPVSTLVSTLPASVSSLPANTLAQLPTLNISSCTVVTSNTPTPDPTEPIPTSLFKPVSSTDWETGPQDASVTIIVYGDFQSSACATLNPVLEQLLLAFPQDVRLVYRYFPKPTNDKAMLSAQAVEAAGLQGKFWEMSDLLFNQQSTWTGMTPTDFETWVQTQATSLNLDLSRFTTDMNSETVVNKLAAALAEDSTIGIPDTPFILINGEIYQGPMDLGSLTSVVALLLLEKKQFVGCPPTVIDVGKQYLAHLSTTQGEIVIQLFPDKAPMTVNSFVFLAKRGWFDGVAFYRVIPGFAAQTGDPSGTGYGGPGYAFNDEINPDLNFDKAGMVGMANTGPGTDGSLFFITLAPRPSLDGKYTVFGQVVQGMDVVQKLTPRDPSQPGTLPTADKIITVTIEEK